jgi:leader peptidase (prepilin peptidase)/N-methyltransferase
VDPVYASAIFVLGLAFGSFLNVCIYRLPLGLSTVTPRSACPKCKQLIAFYDNLPVISWLLLRGRCRHCKTRISARYLFIELLTGVLFVGCYAYSGLTIMTLKYCVFGFLLLGLIFTDAETKLLPDKLTLPGLALGLVFSLMVPVNDVASQFLPGMLNLPFSADIATHLLSLLDSLLGAALGASFIYGAGAIYLRWRGMEGMGFRRVAGGVTVWPCYRADGLDQAYSSLHAPPGRCAGRAPPGVAIRADGLPPLSDAFRRLSGQHGFACTVCR